jgi:hypothetical protein
MPCSLSGWKGRSCESRLWKGRKRKRRMARASMSVASGKRMKKVIRAKIWV